MKKPRSKKRFIIYLVVTAFVVLALYVVNALEPSFKVYFTRSMSPLAVAPDQAKANEDAADLIVNIVKMALWGCLVVVFVRALNSAIFGSAFRLRKGYKAPALARNIFSIVAYVIVFLVLFKWFYPDVALTPLLATSTIFGVIIGLALQETLGNFFAGVSLQADKPFQVGDVITVGQGTGVVESITWRAVKVRTFQNHILLFSNSNLAKESIEVCPRDNLNARLVFFNTLYTDSPAKTIHVVREAVREAENVSQMIAPVVRIRNLGDNGIDFELKYWLENYARYNDTDALIRQRIWYAFRRAGINFAYPTRTLHIERKAKKDAAQVDGTGFAERLAAVDIFAPLSAEEIAKLAHASVSHVFAPGEAVIRAGEEGSSMFVVHSGRVQVQITDNGKPRTVAVLNEGDFFGEMALFTGEPRAANVVAMEETEVLEIGHQAMKHLFETNPDLVESLSHTITERRAGLTVKPDETGPGVDEAEGIIASIKRFFKIK